MQQSMYCILSSSTATHFEETFLDGEKLDIDDILKTKKRSKIVTNIFIEWFVALYDII